MAAVSKWLPMNSFWPSVHISTASQVKWAEVSWGTSFINKNYYYNFDSFVSCIQNGDLSKWRPSEPGYICNCDPVRWGECFHSTKMSWMEARDTGLWQTSKIYTLHISWDSIWPLDLFISPFLSARFKGYFVKKISCCREVIDLYRYCMTYEPTFWKRCMSHKWSRDCSLA